ncbi:MAG: paraquat-inducible protein A [Pseudomonadota bacterium]
MPLKLANLALLVLFPVSWFLPLATARLMPLFGRDEISILSGVQSLWDSDRALAILVALFAMVAPLLKTLALSALQFNLIKPRALPVIEVLGKLAMADVFLIALYIVVTRGVGIGNVETAYGLYVFTALVLASMALAHLEKRK